VCCFVNNSDLHGRVGDVRKLCHCEGRLESSEFPLELLGMSPEFRSTLECDTSPAPFLNPPETSNHRKNFYDFVLSYAEFRP
jgi:hypothetical protein